MSSKINSLQTQAAGVNPLSGEVYAVTGFSGSEAFMMSHMSASGPCPPHPVVIARYSD